MDDKGGKVVRVCRRAMQHVQRRAQEQMGWLIPLRSSSSVPHFQLDSPCTPERLRMACGDFLTAPFAGLDYTPKISC